MLSNEFGVDLELWGLRVFTKENEVGLVCQSSSQPQERLLEVVVGSGRQIVVLEISLSMELNVSSLDLSVFNIDLVTNENDWDVLAHSDNISVPVWNILVGDSRSDIEHDDGTLTLDIITISQTTKLLLTSGIPDVEANLTTVRVELERMDFDTQSWDVFLFELTSSMSLDEGSLTDTSITDKKELELRNTRHI